MNERLRQMLPLVAWVAALGVGLVAFTAMGTGPLAAPTLTDPGSWSRWAHGRDPVIATAAMLRLVVLALGWYLVGVTAVGAVARVAHLTTLVRMTDGLSLPVVRRVLQTSLGVGLATAVAVSSTAVASSRTGPEAALAAAGHEADAPAPPRMRPLPPHEAPTPTTPRLDDTTLPPKAIPHADETTAATTVTVRPGDHLWSIAAGQLAAHGEPSASDEAVAAYWRRLIDVNRDRLVDPANPDLILPGQQFVLPDGPDDDQGRP